MNSKLFKNATWIIVCKIVQSVLGLIISMISARYLGPSNYGLINYAASIVAFVVPVIQLGLRTTIIKEFVDRPDSEGETIGTALTMCTISSVVSIFGIISFVLLVNGSETETLVVCSLYSINLFFQALEMMQYWFQAKLLSKYTSIIALVAYIVVSAYKVFLLVAEKSVYWFAISQAIDYCLISIGLFIAYKFLGGPKLSFSFFRAKQMLSRSKYYIVAGMMVTVFQQTDRLMLKNMVSDTATGYYSVAVACAGLSSFVFSAIIDSMRPVVLESKNKSNNDFDNNMTVLFSIVFYLSLVQCVVMTVLAEPIVKLLYGTAYLPAASALSVVVWYVTYSYIGAVRNIWILANEQQKYLWIINLTGASLNVLLNLVLIPKFDILGAAAASLITQFFTNFLLGFFIKPIRDCNLLMLKALKPNYPYRVVVELLKKSKRSK